MNSYFLAIKRATSNGIYPELHDCWRVYHDYAVLTDSDGVYGESCHFDTRTNSNDQAVIEVQH